MKRCKALQAHHGTTCVVGIVEWSQSSIPCYLCLRRRQSKNSFQVEVDSEVDLYRMCSNYCVLLTSIYPLFFLSCLSICRSMIYCSCLFACLACIFFSLSISCVGCDLASSFVYISSFSCRAGGDVCCRDNLGADSRFWHMVPCVTGF